MKRLLSVLGMFCVVCGVAMAQEKPAAKPSFSLADVHDSPHTTFPFSIGGTMRGDRYSLRQSTLVDMVALAYGVKPEMVQGGPSWLEMRRFDIVAKADPKTSNADLKLMLQSLLTERFGLAIHKGEAPLPAFVLTAPGGKTSMKQSAEGAAKNCKPGQEMAGGVPLNVLSCTAFSADDLAMFLNQAANNYLTDPVLNQTGLEGNWDFTLKWTDMRLRAKAGAEAISIFTAVQNDLGLKLEKKTAPRPVWIVDRASEEPTPNLPAVAKELPAPPLPQFEVATIKPSGPNATRSGAMRSGVVNVSVIPLRMLMNWAWVLSPNDPHLIANAPAWLDTDNFDIVAKAALPEPVAGQPPPQLDDLEFRQMLQQLLIERFNMKIHFEERPIDAYTMYADHPKLKVADPMSRTHCKEGPGPDGKDPRQANPMLTALWSCQNVSMKELADQLAQFATGYVYTLPLDATGLTGRYDLTMAWSSASLTVLKPPPAPGQPVSSDPDGAVTLEEAFRNQLGLKLVKTKRPVSVLVIDHIDETPTAN